MLNQRKKFYSYLIILISLFILVFPIRIIYSSIQESLDNKEINQNKLEKRQDYLSNLENIKEKIKNNHKDIKSKIDKFLVEFDEKEILKYLYDYCKDYSLTPKSISFTEGIKSELWFKLWQVNLNLVFPNERSMLRFLEFVIDENAEYTFFLDKFSYSDFGDEDKENQRKSMTLNLKFYYK